MFSYYTHWCLEGPVVWAISFICCILVVVLLVINIRKSGFSKANFCGILIPVMSILGLIILQGDYVALHIKYSRHEWVNNLVDFFRGYAYKFLKYFFAFHIDVVIVLDCINRFIYICTPDYVAKIMNWPVLVGIQGVTGLISGTYSFLTAKMERDFMKTEYLSLHDMSSTWAYNVAMKIIINT